MSRAAGARPPRVAVAVALGSNLGDRRGHLAWAVDRLATVIEPIRVSSIIETAPVDVPGDQPPYLNAAAAGETALEPEHLLAFCLEVEHARGRRRRGLRAPRTLDLDLVLYGDRVLDSAALRVPHPRFRERRFVLGPLAEIAPDLVDPVTGLTVAELLDALGPPTGPV